MKILKEIYDGLLFSVPVAPPETGGLIGGKNETIRFFEIVDGDNSEDKAFFSPNIEAVGLVLSHWNDRNIEFLGFFHTHPYCCPNLSFEDKEYAKQIMRTVSYNKQFLYFPIVLPKKEIIFYKATYIGKKIDFMIDNVERW
ncbi:MAG: Mov34/MPN/PAD-1 family protein [Clostridia bacterium]|nr:Mov34/MPN/PAD-1 family protein [Clostridia bacterium]